MPDGWSVEEVDATIEDYFRMLEHELYGEPYVKREHNRALQRLLNGRSTGAVEFKHQNISAILIDEGFPYIEGYKPLPNVQGLLRDAVVARLALDATLIEAAAAAVTIVPETPPALRALSDILVDVPVREKPTDRVYSQSRSSTIPRLGVNYLQREANNSKLGAAGEEFVLDIERRRLRSAGKRTLAERIDRVSTSIGDGLGYDILSFETNGKERLIEVKTTSFGRMTPFFARRKEVAVSESRPSEFNLYRVFAFVREPKIFVLSGSLHQSCILEPSQYRASLPYE